MSVSRRVQKAPGRRRVRSSTRIPSRGGLGFKLVRNTALVGDSRRAGMRSYGMEESGPSMRPGHNLGELNIKVPAPFAGISDLGFTAQYRAQEFNAPQRDVPLLFEGPQSPMRRLAEMLQALSDSASDSYA